MGAFKGSCSYLRYMVEGTLPDNYPSLFADSISLRRFVPISSESEALESVGFAPIESPLDTDAHITSDLFLFGHSLGIAYREDKISIPKNVLKQELATRKAELEANGEEVKKSTLKRLEKEIILELKQRTMPKTRIAEIVWDLRKNEVRLFGRGTFAKERAVALFELTFSVRLQQAVYAARAIGMSLSAQERSALINLKPNPVFFDAWQFSAAQQDEHIEQ